MNERTHRAREQRRWKAVRSVFLDSQRRGWFTGNRVDFDRIQNDPEALDYERFLSYLGIEIVEKKSWGWACECFCGSGEAIFNPENRRYRCPKVGGCSLGYVEAVRLAYIWIERGRPKPSSRRAS